MVIGVWDKLNTILECNIASVALSGHNKVILFAIKSFILIRKYTILDRFRIQFEMGFWNVKLSPMVMPKIVCVVVFATDLLS